LQLDEKGFGSVEFIFVTLIALILIAGLSSMVSSETNQIQTGDIAQTRMTGEKMAEIVNTVYMNGVGYTITLTVPASTTVYINNPSGFLSIYSSKNGANISVKIIPKNIQSTSLTAGNRYNVTHANNGTIMFVQN
jgi:hypothetical protein